MFLGKKIFGCLLFFAMFLSPSFAYAADLVDALDLTPFVPLVLDALMLVATGVYEYFVGNGTGIIYGLIWTFVAITIALYLVKMYLPKSWVSFLGFSGGGEIADGISGTKVMENVLKPRLRAVIAMVALLQIKPVYVTDWLVTPFLDLGAIYSTEIIESINDSDVTDYSCSGKFSDNIWLSERACSALVQPVSALTQENNKVIKTGIKFITNGLRGLLTLIPSGGENFLNVLTGLFLVCTFFSCNFFMALLIIQGIFNFGVQLILYPFNVLAYVAKPSDKWFDIWPAFSGLTKAIQQLIITMIACSFILCINIAVIKAMFQWNTSVFVVATGGVATTNLPQVANSSMGFGQHSILWLSAGLTFFLMFKIFEMTRKQLEMYVGKGMDGLYKDTKSNASKYWKKITGALGKK